MNKRTIVIITCILAVAVLAIAIGAAGIGYNYSNPSYSVLIERGQRYLDEGDYDNAILAYNAAIKMEPDKTEAYYGLAEVYQEKDSPVMAAYYLNRGAAETGSASMLHELSRVLEANNLTLADIGQDVTPQQQPVQEMPPAVTDAPVTTQPTAPAGEHSSGPASLNGELLTFFAGATYGDYNTRYGLAEGSTMGGTFTGRFTGKDWTVVFMDTDSVSVLDPGSGRPYDKYRPTYITLGNAAEIFNGQTVSFEQISAMPVVYSANRSGSQITFTAYGLRFELTCDDSGVLVPTGANRIMPPENEREEQTFTLTGQVTDYENGYTISGVEVRVSNVNGFWKSVYTDMNGVYTMTLTDLGVHEIVFSCPDYETVNDIINVEAGNPDLRMDQAMTKLPPPTEPIIDEPEPELGEFVIYGYVRDNAGNPMSGIKVEGHNLAVSHAAGDCREAYTDSNGYYIMEFAKRFTASVSCYTDGYMGGTEVSVPLEDWAVEVDFTLTPYDANSAEYPAEGDFNTGLTRHTDAAPARMADAYGKPAKQHDRRETGR